MALNFKLGTLIMKVSGWSMEISGWTMKIRMSNTEEPYLPRLTSVSFGQILYTMGCHTIRTFQCVALYQFVSALGVAR